MKKYIKGLLASLALSLMFGCQLYFEPREFYSAQAEITNRKSPILKK